METELQSLQSLFRERLEENPGFKKAFLKNPELITKAFATGALAMVGELARVHYVKDEENPSLVIWMLEASAFVRQVRKFSKE